MSLADTLLKLAQPFEDGNYYVPQKALTNNDILKLFMLPKTVFDGNVRLIGETPVFVINMAELLNLPTPEVRDMYLTANINRAKKHQAWEGRG